MKEYILILLLWLISGVNVNNPYYLHNSGISFIDYFLCWTYLMFLFLCIWNPFSELITLKEYLLPRTKKLSLFYIKWIFKKITVCFSVIFTLYSLVIEKQGLSAFFIELLSILLSLFAILLLIILGEFLTNNLKATMIFCLFLLSFSMLTYQSANFNFLNLFPATDFTGLYLLKKLLLNFFLFSVIQLIEKRKDGVSLWLN